MELSFQNNNSATSHIRYDNRTNVWQKRLLFNANTRTKFVRLTETLEDKVMKSSGLTKDEFYKEALMRKGHKPRRNTDSYQTDNIAKQTSKSNSLYFIVCPQTFSHTVVCKVCLTASNTIFDADAFVRQNNWI